MSSDSLITEVDKLRDAVQAHQQQNGLLNEEILRLQKELAMTIADPDLLSATKQALHSAEQLNRDCAAAELASHFFEERDQILQKLFWSICISLKMSLSSKNVSFNFDIEELYGRMKHVPHQHWERLLQSYVSFYDNPSARSP